MKEAKKREEKQKELKEKEKRRKEQKEKERLKQNLILIHFHVLFVISSARVLVRYSRKNFTINIPTGKTSLSTNKAKERVSWTILWTLLRPDKLIIGTTDDKNLDKLVSSSLNALCDFKYFSKYFTLAVQLYGSAPVFSLWILSQFLSPAIAYNFNYFRASIIAMLM